MPIRRLYDVEKFRMPNIVGAYQQGVQFKQNRRLGEQNLRRGEQDIELGRERIGQAKVTRKMSELELGQMPERYKREEKDWSNKQIDRTRRISEEDLRLGWAKEDRGYLGKTREWESEDRARDIKERAEDRNWTLETRNRQKLYNKMDDYVQASNLAAQALSNSLDSNSFMQNVAQLQARFPTIFTDQMIKPYIDAMPPSTGDPATDQKAFLQYRDAIVFQVEQAKLRFEEQKQDILHQNRMAEIAERNSGYLNVAKARNQNMNKVHYDMAQEIFADDWAERDETGAVLKDEITGEILAWKPGTPTGIEKARTLRAYAEEISGMTGEDVDYESDPGELIESMVETLTANDFLDIFVQEGWEENDVKRINQMLRDVGRGEVADAIEDAFGMNEEEQRPTPQGMPNPPKKTTIKSSQIDRDWIRPKPGETKANASRKQKYLSDYMGPTFKKSIRSMSSLGDYSR